MIRQVAARTVRGGLTTSDATTARPARASSAVAIRWPACPVCDSSTPGSGLTAPDLTLARPSGNAIVLSASAAGDTAATGPASTASTAAAAATSPAVARRPSLAATSTAAISSAGQAVAFIAAATPSARPASTGRAAARSPGPPAGSCPAGGGGWVSSARPRQMRPITGTSSPATASGKATTGVAATSAVQRQACGVLVTRSASQNTTANPTVNQIRGSVSGWLPQIARASANTSMAGRYGL